MSNLPKIDPTAIYFCLMGHGTLGSTIPTGARLRGSELLAIKDDPTYYIEEPYSDSEKLAVIRERWPGYAERLGGRP
jgi:hypothetical protein